MSKKFEPLTDEEAQQLTRDELLVRVEAENRHWANKHGRTEADRQAERVLGEIMFNYLPLDGAMEATRDALEGRPNNFWQSRPCDDREAGQ